MMDKMTFLSHIKSLNISSWEDLRNTREYLVLLNSIPLGHGSLVYDPSVDLWSPLASNPCTQTANSFMSKWHPSRASVCKSSVYVIGQW